MWSTSGFSAAILCWKRNPHLFNRIVDSRFKIQDSRFKIQDSRFKIQDSRFKIQDSRFKIQDSRFVSRKIQMTIGQKVI